MFSSNATHWIFGLFPIIVYLNSDRANENWIVNCVSLKKKLPFCVCWVRCADFEHFLPGIYTLWYSTKQSCCGSGHTEGRPGWLVPIQNSWLASMFVWSGLYGFALMESAFCQPTETKPGEHRRECFHAHGPVSLSKKKSEKRLHSTF